MLLLEDLCKNLYQIDNIKICVEKKKILIECRIEKQRILNHLTNCDFDDYNAEYEKAQELLASIGESFSSDGTPIGIGCEE